MLDVHPPHESVHTWKDFFIHLATITLGLLIAIGLEQTVEYFHHRHQLQEARRELSAELEDNRRRAAKNIEQVHKVQAELDNDMALLRANQSSHTPFAAKLDYTWMFYRTPDGAWQTVKQNGALTLMPHEELQSYVYVYAVFAAFMDALVAQNVQMEVAGAIARRAPDGNLSARDVDELITATSDAQGKLAFVARMLQFEELGLKRV
jgi:glucose/arabinose dehydrogenase